MNPAGLFRQGAGWLLLLILLSGRPFLHVSAQSNNALWFGGSDAWLDLGNAAALNLNTFTLECWFKWDGGGVQVSTGLGGIQGLPLISKGRWIPGQEGTVQDLNYFLGLRATDSVLVGDLEEGAGGSFPGSNHPIVGYTKVLPGQWQHAALTYDGSTLSLYLNGGLEAYFQIGVPPRSNSILHAAVGSTLDANGQAEGYFQGSLDEVRIWNIARSADDLRSRINGILFTQPAGLVSYWQLNEDSGRTAFATGTAAVNGTVRGNNWQWGGGTDFYVLYPPDCPSGPLFSMGMVADPQYCDCPTSGNRYFRLSLDKLQAALDTFNNQGVDFVMNLGDIIDRDYASFDSILPMYQQLNMPWHHLLGNHEFTGIPDSLQDSLLNRLNMPDHYYSFTYLGWRFVVLDGTELASYAAYLHPGKQTEAQQLQQSVQGRYNFYGYNGGIGLQQRLWLDSLLTQADGRDEPVMIFCHFPVLPRLGSHNLWNDSALVDIVDAHPSVRAWLNGHQHNGDYVVRNGTHYLTLKGMVENSGVGAFSIMEFHRDHLFVRGWGFELSRYMPISLNNAAPVSIALDRDSILPGARAGSLIGRLSTVDSTQGDVHAYFLVPGSGDTDNARFQLNRDSLVLRETGNLGAKRVYSIRVASFDCEMDSVSQVLLIYVDSTITRIDAETVEGAAEPERFDMTVSPNPFRDQLKADFNLAVSNARLELYTIVGKQVRSWLVNGRSAKLDIEGLPRGVYNLVFRDQAGNSQVCLLLHL